MPNGSGRFWMLYPLWIAVCFLLFLLLQRIGMDDPSRPPNRIRSEVAGEIALAIVERADPQRFGDYEVVNVAMAQAREVAPDPRWIVLLDRNPRSALRDAIVVELEPRSGKLIRIREVLFE